MKVIAVFLIASIGVFAQAPNIPVHPVKAKHAKLKSVGAKIKHDVKIGGEVIGGALVLGLVVVGSGGAAVKVY